MVACTGQGGTTNSKGKNNGTQANSTEVNTTTPSNTSAFDALPERPVRVATTEEDYNIFNGYWVDYGFYLTKNTQRRISMGDKLHVDDSGIVSECGYYKMNELGHMVKNLYYSASGLPMLNAYGHLICTYGDIPAIELDRQNDVVMARDDSNGNITAYKCKLVGCTIGWVDSESAIWNQNDLIPVSDPNSLQLIDLNGQPRSTPMDYEFGEELIAECNGQSYQVHADSYVYAIDDTKIEITGGDVKIKYENGLTDVLYGYDLAKLSPGLYYFQDLGIYKII